MFDTTLNFFTLCIPFRYLMTYCAKKAPMDQLKHMGYMYIALSLGMFYSDITTMGVHTSLAPFHGLMYGLFSMYAIDERDNVAWKFLFIDTTVSFITRIGNHLFP